MFLEGTDIFRHSNNGPHSKILNTLQLILSCFQVVESPLYKWVLFCVKARRKSNAVNANEETVCSGSSRLTTERAERDADASVQQ